MDTGEPLSTIRDRILSANAYIGAFPLAEALDHRRRRRHRRPLHRHRPRARAHDPPLRLERQTIGTSSPPEPSPATSSNAARSAPAATARWTGRTFRTWPTSATRSSKPSPTARSPSPNTRAPAAASIPTSSRSSLLYELGDPRQLHHAGLHRRLHHHPSRRHRPRPRARHRHSRRPAPAHAEALHQLRRTAGKPSERWSTAGRRLSKKPAPPTASCASASPQLGLQLRRNLHRVLRRERLPRPRRAARSRSARSPAPHRRPRRRTAKPSTASRAN